MRTYPSVLPSAAKELGATKIDESASTGTLDVNVTVAVEESATPLADAERTEEPGINELTVNVAVPLLLVRSEIALMVSDTPRFEVTETVFPIIGLA